MMFLTGNFLNAFDRDGLHGSPLDSVLLSASDETRLELSGSSASKDAASNNSHGNMDHLCGHTRSWPDGTHQCARNPATFIIP